MRSLAGHLENFSDHLAAFVELACLIHDTDPSAPPAKITGVKVPVRHNPHGDH
jgi:hypothetical protein